MRDTLTENAAITLDEEEISDVSVSTFYVFDHENAGARRPGLQLAQRTRSWPRQGCGGCAVDCGGGGPTCCASGGGDAVDWVERISLAETRNYVQRVVENLQVYAARLGASASTVEPNLHRVTVIEPRTKPTFVDAIPR